jgi:RNA polymerase sigma factor (TIGR02999 family)
MPTTRHDVTRLLAELRAGNQTVVPQLVPLVYDELRQLAARYIHRERSGHTLQATALVHEAYLRLVDQSDIQWQNRAHFIGVAARVMRQILVDYARGRGAAKRGGDQDKLPLEEAKVSLDNSAAISDDRLAGLLDLEDALNRLAEFDPQQARMVELRFFGGLTVEETGEVLGISPASVKREWTMARSWLHREMTKKSS